MPIGGFVADVPLEENRHFYIPGTSTNELAGANRKHTVTGTKNGSAITISDAPFQAGASNYSISTANSDTIIITITGLHLTYGANAGIVFGNTTWRAQDVKIETSTDGGTSWTTRTNQTSQTRTTVHKYFTSGGTATNAIRYTLTNFATSSTRINHLYAYNYNNQDQYFAELYKDHDIYANWEFQDNRVLKFGTGGDLQIYHDNNYSYIREAGTGDLRIAGASNVQIWNSDIDSQMANFANGGAATLYYAGAAKLSTSSTGISVVGGADLYSNTSNNTLNIGRDAGQKLGIYVDDGNITLTADQDLDENGNHNFILDRTFQGTGANNFKIQKDGTDQLTIDTSGTVTIAGNLTVIGTSTTLNTATLDVEDKNITLNKGSGNTSGSADGAGITIQDAVDSNTDATILWNQSISGFKFSHDIRLDDDLRLEFGDSSDLIIRHANNNRSYISGGDIEISTNSFRLFNLAGTTGMITATTSGVNLLQNTSVTGALSVTGNISSGIYEIGDDVTSTSSTSQTTIAQFSASSVRSCRFTVQVTNSTDSTYHTTELLLVHDGTTPGITEFGAIFTGAAAEATFDADISGGNVRLRATPASSDSMTFKVVRHMITT